MNPQLFTFTINYVEAGDDTGFLCTITVRTADRNSCFATSSAIWDNLYRKGCNLLNDRPIMLVSAVARDIDNRIRRHNLRTLAAAPKNIWGE